MLKITTYRLVLPLVLGTLLFLSFKTKDSETLKGVNLLKHCIESYLKLDAFSMDVEYSVFTNTANFNNPSEKGKGKVIRKGSNYYNETLGDIIIANDKYILSVNNTSEVIYIEDRANKEMLPIGYELDSLVNNIDRAKKIKNGYQYEMNTREISKVDLLLDQNGYINIWRSYYRKKMDFGNGYVSVIGQLHYLNFNTNPEISDQTFSINSFVVIKDKEVFLQDKYKTYHIFNNLK